MRDGDSELMIPLTGCASLDAAPAEAAQATEEMLDLGLCPNGCGPMEERPDGADCEECGFSLHRTPAEVGPCA